MSLRNGCPQPGRITSSSSFVLRPYRLTVFISTTNFRDMTMNRHSMQDAIKLNAQRQLCDNCRASVKGTGKNAPQLRLPDSRFNYQLWKNYELWKRKKPSDADCCVVLFSWEQVLEAKVRCILCTPENGKVIIGSTSTSNPNPKSWQGQNGVTRSDDDVRACASFHPYKYNDDTNTPQRLGGALEVLKSCRSMAGPETGPKSTDWPRGTCRNLCASSS